MQPAAPRRSPASPGGGYLRRGRVIHKGKSEQTPRPLSSGGACRQSHARRAPTCNPTASRRERGSVIPRRSALSHPGAAGARRPRSPLSRPGRSSVTLPRTIHRDGRTQKSPASPQPPLTSCSSGPRLCSVPGTHTTKRLRVRRARSGSRCPPSRESLSAGLEAGRARRRSGGGPRSHHGGRRRGGSVGGRTHAGEPRRQLPALPSIAAAPCTREPHARPLPSAGGGHKRGAS